MNDEPTNDYPDWGLLGAWVAVVESESVSHAARRLGLSQAGPLVRVQMLEGKPGPDLLDRGPRPAKVTLAGQRLYETSTELLKGADEMLENVRGKVLVATAALCARYVCFVATVSPRELVKGDL